MFQVKRLVQKVVHRDTLNYRKVTDKPDTKDMDKKEEKETEEDMAVDSKDDTKEEGKDRASSDKSPAVTDEELAQGMYQGPIKQVTVSTTGLTGTAHTKYGGNTLANSLRCTLRKKHTC